MEPLLVKYDPVLVDQGFKLEIAKPGDAGMDLPVVMNDKLKVAPHMDYYINTAERWFDIPPHGFAEIPCGLAVKVPEDAWGNIRPRSSTGWKRRLSVTDATIDSGYTGPIYILVHNPNNTPVRVHEFDRLAQMVIIPKHPYGGVVKSVSELPDTARGNTGFGSSGGMKEQKK